MDGLVATNPVACAWSDSTNHGAGKMVSDKSISLVRSCSVCHIHRAYLIDLMKNLGHIHV